MSLLHASLVASGKIGILIRGPSGSGKSQLCLQLIDEETKLVADDQVNLRIDNAMLLGSAPAALAGKLEIRGLGIVECAFVPEVEVKLVVDLQPFENITRMPESDELSVELLGLRVCRFSLDPQSPAAVNKVQAALAFFQLR